MTIYDVVKKKKGGGEDRTATNRIYQPTTLFPLFSYNYFRMQIRNNKKQENKSCDAWIGFKNKITKGPVFLRIFLSICFLFKTHLIFFFRALAFAIKQERYSAIQRKFVFLKMSKVPASKLSSTSFLFRATASAHVIDSFKSY